MNKQPHIDETLDKLTELINSQQRALDCSNELISMKNRMIELCNQETAIYKKEVMRLRKTIFWLSIMFTITSIVLIVL
tara:strand:- start:1551 stop:1784 length:234 start_codon:yes stop_codon:yes gene_type:complete